MLAERLAAEREQFRQAYGAQAQELEQRVNRAGDVKDILEQARDQGLIVMTTPETAFTTCGLLYEAGLRGVPIEWPEGE